MRTKTQQKYFAILKHAMYYILLVFFIISHVFGAADLPRFASMRSDNINTRVGPGLQYPVEWAYVRAKFPVKIIKEYEHWRLIEDCEGQQSWVHQRMLSGLRTVIFMGRHPSPLYKASDQSSPILADVEPGVIAMVDKIEKNWIRIKINQTIGWVQYEQVWGIKF